MSGSLTWIRFKEFMFGRYAGLLTSMVVLLILQPTIKTSFGRYLLEGLFIIMLLTGLRAVGVNALLLKGSLALFLASLASGYLGMAMEQVGLFAFGILGRTLFLVLVALTILVALFSARKVTGDTLAGAVCVYLLIAYIGGLTFLLVEVCLPESFTFTAGHGRVHLWLSRELSPFLYFSLVTLTTVGYGDMAPVSQMARMLATLEALLGQIYLAILVARLVGMYLVNQTTSGES